jgi:hypothetical protein
MKSLRFAAVAALLPLIGGCPLLSDLQSLGTDPPAAPSPSVGDLTSAFDSPPVTSGPIRVRFLNEADVAADVRLSMRVAGLMVHQSSRRVPAGSTRVLVGPDRADSILVEITQLKTPEPRSLPATALFLGLDFFSGETVEIRILGDPPVVVPPDNTNDNVTPPPPPPTPVSVVDTGDVLDAIRIDPVQVIDVQPHNGGTLPIPSPIPPPGGVSPFPGWPAGGAPSGGAPTPPVPAPPDSPSGGVIVNVVVDLDGDPTNGNETLLLVAPDRSPDEPILWNPSGLDPGVYLLYLDELVDGRVVRTGPTAVRVNAAPALVFDSPVAGAVYVVGDALPIGFAGVDDDDDARIAVFLDTDQKLDGDEVLLAEALSEDDLAQRTLIIDTVAFVPGTYFIAGVIDDGVSQAVAYAGPITIIAKPDGN